VTPERTLEYMRERLYAVSKMRRKRKCIMVPVDEFLVYADALARTLDERNEFASRVRGPSTPDARAIQPMPVR
jgi:hypothetical protein